MWKLVHVDDEQEVHRLLVGEEYVVGRKDCSVLLLNDQSISRVHARLWVTHPNKNLAKPSVIPRLGLKDESKYGTWLEGERLQTGVIMHIGLNCNIQFGVFNSKFRAEYVPLVVVSSGQEITDRTSLGNVVLQLGGHLLSHWDDQVTHFVTRSLKVTVKTICALIALRPVVQAEYFTEYLSAVKSRKPLPSLSSFSPQEEEPSLPPGTLELTPRPERTTLFCGKTFLFLNARQHKRLAVPIRLAGGTARLKDPSILDEDLTEDICFVEPEAQVGMKIDATLAMLRRLALRLILEAEIGLAVVFCSTKFYCNARAPVPPVLLASLPAGCSLTQSLLCEPENARIPLTQLGDSQAVVVQEPEDTQVPFLTYDTKTSCPLPRNYDYHQQGTAQTSFDGVDEKNKQLPEITNTKKNHKDSVIQPASHSVVFGVEAKTSCSPVVNKANTLGGRARTTSGCEDIVSHGDYPLISKDGGELSVPSANHGKVCGDVEHVRDSVDRDTARTGNRARCILKSPDSKSSLVAHTAEDWISTCQETGGPIQKNKLTSCFSFNNKKRSRDGDETSSPSKHWRDPDTTRADAAEFGTTWTDTARGIKRLHSPEAVQDWKGRVNVGTRDGQREQVAEWVSAKASDGGHEAQKHFQNTPGMDVEEWTSTSSTIKMEKKEESSDCERRKEPDKILVSELPTGLLAIRLCNLVVNSGNGCTGSVALPSADNESFVNFKSFRKVPWSGMLDLPTVIGGRELHAHDRLDVKRDADFQQVAQEMAQKEREDSQANDLFRWDPKRRR
uniref:nibrin isoform X2 n=1 Tax=Myxine glutinosa TaxID=7769 RepID=UPI00358ED6F9